jgi:hypothetical protein
MLNTITENNLYNLNGCPPVNKEIPDTIQLESLEQVQVTNVGSSYVETSSGLNFDILDFMETCTWASAGVIENDELAQFKTPESIKQDNEIKATPVISEQAQTITPEVVTSVHNPVSINSAIDAIMQKPIEKLINVASEDSENEFTETFKSILTAVETLGYDRSEVVDALTKNVELNKVMISNYLETFL